MLLLGLWLLIGCSSKQSRFDTRFLAFGTLMDLTIVGIPPDRAEQAAKVIEADFAQMHKTGMHGILVRWGMSTKCWRVEKHFPHRHRYCR